MSTDRIDRFYATTTGKLVAHRAPAGIILAFGKHYGHALGDVPFSYLRWMQSASGIAFMPPELVVLVAEELAARQTYVAVAETVRALTAAARPIDLDPVHDWALTAPAPEVEELIDELRMVVKYLQRVQLDHADEVCAGLNFPPVIELHDDHHEEARP